METRAAAFPGGHICNRHCSTHRLWRFPHLENAFCSDADTSSEISAPKIDRHKMLPCLRKHRRAAGRDRKSCPARRLQRRVDEGVSRVTPFTPLTKAVTPQSQEPFLSVVSLWSEDSFEREEKLLNPQTDSRSRFCVLRLENVRPQEAFSRLQIATFPSSSTDASSAAVLRAFVVPSKTSDLRLDDGVAGFHTAQLMSL